MFGVSALAFGCMGNGDIRGEISNDTENSDTTASETEEEKELSLGEIDGDVYESDFIGLGFKLDDGWSFYSDDQIKELNNLTADVAGDEYMDLIKDATVVYDMYAVDSNQLNNVNINLEKVNPVQLLALDIAENYKLLVDSMKSTYENMGYTNFDYEITTVTVDGKELDALEITAEINGSKMYQCSFSKKCNGYLASVAVTTFMDDTVSEVLDNFYWTK